MVMACSFLRLAVVVELEEAAALAMGSGPSAFSPFRSLPMQSSSNVSLSGTLGRGVKDGVRGCGVGLKAGLG